MQLQPTVGQQAPRPGTVDMRRFERVDIALEVTLQSESNFFSGFSMNISEGGLFIATHDCRPQGETLTLEMNLPDGGAPFTVVCEVRWVRDYNPMAPDTVPGMGVKFVDVDDMVKARIQRFIEMERDPLFYDDEDDW